MISVSLSPRTHHHLAMKKTTEEFANLMNKVRGGDEQAIAKLWEDYFQKLVRIAAKRLPTNLRRTGDEEDVALSAFTSFIAVIRSDRVPDLSGRENLWGLLITLTGRKASAHLRYQTRQKRGGGNVRGESVFADSAGEIRGSGMGAVSGGAEAPDLHAELAEACEVLLDKLPDDQLRQIAVMRMDGFLVDEIAKRLELSKRAVERRLQLIRKTWAEEAAESEEKEAE